MKKDHSVLDFVRLSVAQKVEFGRNVIVKVKANPKFATPDVSVEELEAKNTLLETRSVAAMSGGKEARRRRAYWLREPTSGSDWVCSV